MGKSRRKRMRYGITGARSSSKEPGHGRADTRRLEDPKHRQRYIRDCQLRGMSYADAVAEYEKVNVVAQQLTDEGHDWRTISSAELRGALRDYEQVEKLI